MKTNYQHMMIKVTVVSTFTLFAMTGINADACRLRNGPPGPGGFVVPRAALGTLWRYR
jgi:hypothetical protein